jgi:CRISPR-associated protein Cmr4
MSSKNALLFIHAQTSLHPGTGTALGTVDMPIQRERHTEWPMIAGSSLKGVIRDHCDPGTRQGDEYDQWCDVFGAESGSDNPQAGAISVTDARILAFPVRSARGVFAWVTCKAVLDRLLVDAKLAGFAPDALPSSIHRDECLVCSDEVVVKQGDKRTLLLEEYDFDVSQPSVELQNVTRWIGEQAIDDPDARPRLLSHLVAVPNTEFTYFTKHATEVVARIGLDYETKTVKNGALFYEEFLPPETLMYSVLLANRSRRASRSDPNSRDFEALDVQKFILDQIRQNEILQIGANETIGKGICLVRSAIH